MQLRAIGTTRIRCAIVFVILRHARRTAFTTGTTRAADVRSIDFRNDFASGQSPERTSKQDERRCE
jgi:hypothetical protein